jgi:hypothetical protein
MKKAPLFTLNASDGPVSELYIGGSIQRNLN